MPPEVVGTFIGMLIVLPICFFIIWLAATWSMGFGWFTPRDEDDNKEQ